MPQLEVIPYLDPESGLVVQSLDAPTAFNMVEKLPCLVHLLPHFRMAALNKFSGGSENDVFLSGCSPNRGGGGGGRNGMALYWCALARPCADRSVG